MSGSDWRRTLWSSIVARIDADTGTGGLAETAGTNLLTGKFNNQAPSNQTFPFVTFNAVNAAAVHAFNTGVYDVDLDLHIWAKEKPTDGDTDGLELIQGISTRLVGDWLTTSAVPTFGFHNFAPTLSSWTGDVFNHQDSIDSHEPDAGILHQVESFTIIVSKAGL